MSWAAELGVGAVGPGAGATLRLLAAAARAKTVVEIGTGIGVSGVWLLRGMRDDGVLTTIDVEPEYQAMARQSFAAAGFAPGRARLIAGLAQEVLPRLADGAYDLVFVDGDVTEYPQDTEAAHRLLRPGGLLIVNNALAGDPAAGPAIAASGAAADEPDGAATVARLLARVRDAPEWTPALLAAGAGLLCAVKR